MSDIKDVKLLQQQQQRIGIFISAVFNVQNKVNGSRRKRSKMFVFFLLCGTAPFISKSCLIKLLKRSWPFEFYSNN
jgi:hypothetical protein